MTDGAGDGDGSDDNWGDDPVLRLLRSWGDEEEEGDDDGRSTAADQLESFRLMAMMNFQYEKL